MTHLTFQDLWHFKTFDTSWHLTLHDIWHLKTFDTSWKHYMTFDTTWHLTFHDILYLMTFFISWHLTFSTKSCSSPSHLESLTQRFDTQPGQPDTKVSETKFLGWGEGGRWMWGWGVIHTVFKWLTLAKMFMSCSSMTVGSKCQH